jgi:hypothetical protein
MHPHPPPITRLPRTVSFLGVASLLTDARSEMIYPLLPLFLASLGTSVTFLGLIEGVAESTTSRLMGVIWDRISPSAAFTVGSGLAVASALLFLAITSQPRARPPVFSLPQETP